MMKATPPSPLVVTKPEFLLEILTVPLDPPAQLGGVYQGTAADVRKRCCEAQAFRVDDQADCVSARRQGMSSSMRACGQPLMRRVSSSTK